MSCICVYPRKVKLGKISKIPFQLFHAVGSEFFKGEQKFAWFTADGIGDPGVPYSGSILPVHGVWNELRSGDTFI